MPNVKDNAGEQMLRGGLVRIILTAIVFESHHERSHPIWHRRSYLDQVSAVVRLRHVSIRTEKAYLYHIKHFILFLRKQHPREMGEDEIRAYLTHLAVDRHVSASTQNVALASLLFLFCDALKLQLDRFDHVERARLPTRLPVVFAREEIAAILHRLSGGAQLVASLMYGSGLRMALHKKCGFSLRSRRKHKAGE